MENKPAPVNLYCEMCGGTLVGYYIKRISSKDRLELCYHPECHGRPTKEEIIEDIRTSRTRICIDRQDGRGTVEAIPEEIEKMKYWELWRAWRQAEHTRRIIAGY